MRKKFSQIVESGNKFKKKRGPTAFFLPTSKHKTVCNNNRQVGREEHTHTKNGNEGKSLFSKYVEGLQGVRNPAILERVRAREKRNQNKTKKEKRKKENGAADPRKRTADIGGFVIFVEILPKFVAERGIPDVGCSAIEADREPILGKTWYNSVKLGKTR